MTVDLMTEWCVCGHDKGAHRRTFNTNWCAADSNPYGRDCGCKEFRLNPNDKGKLR